MEFPCSHCQHALNWLNDSRFQCPQCHHHYQQQAHCPECQHLLQTLSACGSVSYFCQHGHGLISRQRVLFSYLPVQE
ncbi:zinc ribbon domain-containing protein [Symbiopectobacterium purcellii]|uniref:Zinc ribbon domain-containing protein n=1 Tax=Symbiopectobacterium purcellii TaxID=2871826 RepID=A0ABX9ANQ6_9ENTR|nr:zinc ribbon domain-containing protein [Symbiopectobacterium purcellii]QZN94625.1 zinc ribbon domain-containing protein [Symbiopectobacterium purcellii]